MCILISYDHIWLKQAPIVEISLKKNPKKRWPLKAWLEFYQIFWIIALQKPTAQSLLLEGQKSFFASEKHLQIYRNNVPNNFILTFHINPKFL